MTHERALEIVAGVETRHPKFKPHGVLVVGDNAKVEFDEPTVDPRRVGDWFAESNAYLIQIGYEVKHNYWFAYFREATK